MPDEEPLEVMPHEAAPEKLEKGRWQAVRLADWLMVLSGFAVLAGSFLPWGSMTSTSAGSTATLGMDADGPMTVVLGGALILLAIISTQVGREALGVLYGLVALGAVTVSVVSLLDIERVTGKVAQGQVASPEIGLFVIVASAGVGFVVLLLRQIGARQQA